MEEPETITPGPLVIAAVRDTIAMADIRNFFDQNFGEVARVLSEQGVTPVGAPVGVYWGVPTDTADVAVGFPTASPIAQSGVVGPIEIVSERAVQTVHQGDFEQLSDSWQALHAWATERGVTPGELMWETYLTEPVPGADPADMRTQLTWSLDG